MVFPILKKLILSAAALTVTLLGGCNVEEFERFLGLDVPKEAIFMISFHREVNFPRGNLKAEMLLPMLDGTSRIVERYPSMSSHYIVDIAAQPVPGKEGFYRLFLKLDQKGRMMWVQLTAMSKTEPIAILLDGVYLGEFKAQTVTDGTEKWVELPLDIDGARTVNIVKYANQNYRFFNGGKSTDNYRIFPEND